VQNFFYIFSQFTFFISKIYYLNIQLINLLSNKSKNPQEKVWKNIYFFFSPLLYFLLRVTMEKIISDYLLFSTSN